MPSTPATKRARRRDNQLALLEGRVNPPHGELSTYAEYRCRCEPCRTVMREYHAAYREIHRQQLGEDLYAYEHQTPNGSGINRKKPWTTDEIEFATSMRSDGRYLFNVVEVAEYLGRTIIAVKSARKRYSPKPGVPNVRRNLL